MSTYDKYTAEINEISSRGFIHKNMPSNEWWVCIVCGSIVAEDWTTVHARVCKERS